MLRFPNAILVLLVCLTVASVAMAGPSLLITKPPVTGGVNAGPNPIDPNALQGQWFTDLAGQNPEVRPNEFYDNVLGAGGGAMGAGAIMGNVTSITYDLQGLNIVAFDVMGMISNDTGTESGQWLFGQNPHGEVLPAPSPNYVGTLFNTYLTADFAADPVSQPSPYVAPAMQQTPQILAVNHDHLAWYCFNELTEPGMGGFWVPTWDFGDIPVGQSSQLLLQFAVAGLGMAPSDPRFAALVASLAGADILQNRTTSLKISDWEEFLALDTGIPYPSTGTPPQVTLSSSVSVFHDEVPEPATVSLLAIGALAMLRRKKQ